VLGNFLLVIAQFGSSSRIRAFADHRSNNQKSEFLLFVVVVLEVFRRGTKAPPGLIRCGAVRTCRNAENTKKINLLWAWHSPCSLAWRVGLRAIVATKKATEGER
jgi:hypothetical protein